MSGQPLRKPQDAQDFLQDYLNVLNLQSAINEQNLDANRVYKSTGQLPPVSQMPDTRSPEDKMKDVQALKTSIIKAIEPISSQAFGQTVVSEIMKSPLNANNTLLIFVAQRVGEIVDKLKANYAIGIKGDENDAIQMVKLYEDMYKKMKKGFITSRAYLDRPISTNPEQTVQDITKIATDVEKLYEVDVILTLRKLSTRLESMPDIAEYAVRISNKLQAFKNITQGLDKELKLRDGYIFKKTYQSQLNINFEPYIEKVNELEDILRDIPNFETYKVMIGQIKSSFTRTSGYTDRAYIFNVLQKLDENIPNPKLLKQRVDELAAIYRACWMNYESESWTGMTLDDIIADFKAYATATGISLAIVALAFGIAQSEFRTLGIDTHGRPSDEDLGTFARQMGPETPALRGTFTAPEPTQMQGPNFPALRGSLTGPPPPPEPTTLFGPENAPAPTIDWRSLVSPYELGQYVPPEGEVPLYSASSSPYPAFGSFTEATSDLLRQQADANQRMLRDMLSGREPDIADYLLANREPFPNIPYVPQQPYVPPSGITTGFVPYNPMGGFANLGGFNAALGRGMSGEKKGRGRPKGSVKPKIPFQAKIAVQEGIKSGPRFSPFGKYVIDKNNLMQDVITLKSMKGGNIIGYPNKKVSRKLGDVFRKMTGGMIPSFDDMASLDEEEKKYLHDVAKKSNLLDKISVPTPNKDERERDLHQFEVMKGEIMSGNDNKEFIKKFKILLMKLQKNNELPKREVNEILGDLAELGY